LSITDRNASYASTIEWLHGRAIEGWTIPVLIDELAEKLREMGMPLFRLHCGMPVLHPLYSVGAYTWFPDRGVVVDTYTRGSNAEESYRRSPVRPIFESGADEGRIPFGSDDSGDGYEMLVRAAAEGGTDYYLQLMGFADRSVSPINQEGIILSYISADAGGFTEDDLSLLRSIRNPLFAELKSLTRRKLAEDILQAYLGKYSVDRVFSGQVQLGDGDTIEAVVVFSDLRGSSTLAEHYDLEGFLSVLNEYYEITSGAVRDGGGEILRYIGDASLAVFPIERYADEEAACRAAMDAALDAERRGETVNAARESRGEPPIRFGIGLHTGTVMYGNIGIRERIEFTVIGKAANEAARIEAKCKELDETILVSDSFAERLPIPWRSHGVFDLRNIGRPIGIFSPAR
jgi:adenylate cyclase